MPRILVTGGTGFVGEALVRRLLAVGWSVHLVVRESSDISRFSDKQDKLGFSVYDGSVESLICAIELSRPQLVYHLASLYLAEHCSDDVDRLISSNVIFASQLLEAMSQKGISKFINTGTSWQYYHSESYRAVNLYAATKQAFESILSFYSDRFEISYVTLRLFDTYGPGDKRQKLMNLIADSYKNNTELGVSPGDQLVDISYIDDVVESFYLCGEYLMAAQKLLAEEYFVSGERFTIKALVCEVEKAFNFPGKVVFGVRPYRDREVMILPSIINRTPPWDNNICKTLVQAGVLKI